MHYLKQWILVNVFRKDEWSNGKYANVLQEQQKLWVVFKSSSVLLRKHTKNVTYMGGTDRERSKLWHHKWHEQAKKGMGGKQYQLGTVRHMRKF